MKNQANRTRIRGRRGVRTMALAMVALFALLGAFMPILSAAPTAAQSVDPNWSPPPAVYIPETGQMLDRLFLDLWRNGGGAGAYGYPITPEVTGSDGTVVQYLQYARFEYWPNGDADGNVVRLGDIGRDLRPQLVPRNFRLAAVPGRKAGAASELDAMTRAWLPLAGKEAAKPDTADRRYIAETGHSIQFGFKAFWEATGEAAYLGNPLTEEYALAGITYQIFERGQLAWSQGKAPWMVALGEVLAERMNLDTSPRPQGDIPTYSEELFIPPPAPVETSGAPPPPAGYSRSIVVSIGMQQMWVYEGDQVVLSSLVSTGRPGFDTPTGLFFINTKIDIQDMAGVIGGESYNVPDVPWVLYFTDVGHAIHGTYWHNNFGQVMSHGCINLPMDVASWVYSWAGIGTPVLIVG